ncbi:MAG: hypothetical protein HUK21_09000 [Fibrobacteraceae bacterium]|nr:hypothetical protein [Fibrobacteraceae bacterium]MCF0216595.1 hypothetical protein [Fibrobacteraceae bacterium]
MKKILLLLAAVSSLIYSKEIFFDSHYTLWSSPDILIWTPDEESPLDPKEFCLSLKRNNTGIGEPKCRVFGEWSRDSIPMRYGKWLKNNLEPGLKPEYLHARHPAMHAKIQALEDNIVLFVTREENRIKAAIFDETATEPKMAGTVFYSNDKVALSDDIASTFFDIRTKRRLTKQERQKKMTEPDDFYKETPDFRGWAGVALGYSQAHVPLTPKNWTSSHEKSQVRNYRITKDSTSLWNFIDDSDPFLNVYLGGSWYGFIGAELIYRFAKHNVKTDPKDTVYQELDHWSFYQHEIGINVIFSRTYSYWKWLDISPFAFLGFQYSFFVEDIGLKDGVKDPSRAYTARIEFEDAYKGALVGFGSQFAFLKHYGLGVRTGISSRGRNIYSDPTPDAAAEPTTIGGSTIDWFINVGLEYHFSK